MTWTPPMPEREAIPPEELAAYDSVVARQTAYGYAGFVERSCTRMCCAPFRLRAQPYFGALLNSPLIAAG